jgi:[ribosomal protein S18]-alanine N-acetyltransferase
VRPNAKTKLTQPISSTRREMQPSDLAAVLAIEVQCYSHPWSQGNFSDSLVSGYCAQVLEQAPRVPQSRGVDTVPAADNATKGQGLHAPPPLLGYFIAMPGADEWHLLNICIAPTWQGQGLGTALLAAVAAEGRARGMARLLLEVRASNVRARALYARHGFVEDGLRRAYYPGAGQREDAVLMSRSLELDSPAGSPAPLPSGSAVGSSPGSLHGSSVRSSVGSSATSTTDSAARGRAPHALG